MENLKYTDTFNFILRTLRDVRDYKSDSFISLPAILEILDYKASFSEALEMTKYMETRGWVKPIFIVGDIRVQITSSGLIHLEELGEEFNTLFVDYMGKLTEKKGRLELKTFFEEKDPKKKVIDLLNIISSRIIEKEGHETDLNKDIEIIKLELSKLQPNFEILDQKFSALMNLEYIASDLQQARNFMVHDY